MDNPTVKVYKDFSGSEVIDAILESGYYIPDFGGDIQLRARKIVQEFGRRNGSKQVFGVEGLLIPDYSRYDDISMSNLKFKLDNATTDDENAVPLDQEWLDFYNKDRFHPTVFRTHEDKSLSFLVDPEQKKGMSMIFTSYPALRNRLPESIVYVGNTGLPETTIYPKYPTMTNGMSRVTKCVQFYVGGEPYLAVATQPLEHEDILHRFIEEKGLKPGKDLFGEITPLSGEGYRVAGMGNLEIYSFSNAMLLHGGSIKYGREHEEGRPNSQHLKDLNEIIKEFKIFDEKDGKVEMSLDH